MTLVFNQRQRQAIEHVHGPMLVIAGAGTGKTTVLVHRIVQLIANGHARPDEILAVTYTNNAIADLQRQLAELAPEAREVQVETFHGYCHRIVRHADPAFRLLVDKDLWIYLRRRISELPRKRFIKASDPGKFLDDLLKFFDRCHDDLVTPATYSDYVRALKRGEQEPPRIGKSGKEELSSEEVLARCEEIAAVFTKVEEMLAAEDLGTFGHLMTRAIGLLRSDATILRREQQRARFMLLDEFQDANFAQIELTRLLAGDARNVFAVGDPDQAIYRFRGASSGSFRQFLQAFPDATRVRLIENRRSLPPILTNAFAVIRKNPEATEDRTGFFDREPLVSARADAAQKRGKTLRAEPVTLLCGPSGKEFPLAEAQEVACLIRERQAALGCPWSRFAVLYRSHTARALVQEELTAMGISVAVQGVDIEEDPQFRDLMACLKAVHSAADSVSLLRVAAREMFGISGEALRELTHGLPRDGQLVQALDAVPGGRAAVQRLRRMQAIAAAEGTPAVAVVERCITEFGLDRESPTLRSFVAFVQQWQEKPITRVGNLAEFLDYYESFQQARGSVRVDIEPDCDSVRMMTVHAAKGLEFDHVYVLRAQSQSFPTVYRPPLFEFPDALNPQAVAEGDGGTVHEQEERRLFYVALTRARDTLLVSAKSGSGQRDSSPPGFLRELLADRTLAPVLRRATPRAQALSLLAAAAPVSAISSWMALAPRPQTLELSLSATAIERYKRCPLRFKIERDWKLPGDAPASMQFGQVMHGALKGFYDARLSGQTPSLPALLEDFRRRMQSAAFDEELQRSLYQQEGEGQLQRFIEDATADPADVVSTERIFTTEIGGVRVNGRIDRIDRSPDGGAVVTDYKTGKPKAQEDADKSIQLSIYAIAAERSLQQSVARLVLHNLEDGSRLVTSRTRAALVEAEEEVRAVAARIADGEFPATPGRHCDQCPYFSICPEKERRLVTIEQKNLVSKN